MRKSVRSFQPVSIEEWQLRELEKARDTAYSPFGGKTTLKLRFYDLSGPMKPSTYGVISGAELFMLLDAGDDNESALSGGFRMEQLVLKATEVGLGTCWIGGTFKESQFEDSCEEGEQLQAIVATGVPASKMRLLERAGRLMAGSDKRKPFGKLFFDKLPNTPLSESDIFGRSLEMMRLAPSSLNSQPWRAVVNGHKVDFYLTGISRMHMIDLGIGLCHFYLMEKELGRKGEFIFNPDSNKTIVSYILE